MPLISQDKMIKMYYEEVKEQYPDLTFEEFKKVCKSPFLAIIEWMKDPWLPWIKIKFLGQIKPFEGTVLDRIKVIKNRLESGDKYKSRDHLEKELAHMEQYLDLMKNYEQNFILDDE